MDDGKIVSLPYRNYCTSCGRVKMRRVKYSMLLPTVLISQHVVGFKRKSVIAKAESKKDVENTSPLGSISLDHYTKRALKGLSDVVSGPATAPGDAPTESTISRVSSNFYDTISASVLDEKSKRHLRDLSTLSDKLQSQFEKSTTNLRNPFAVNLGLLRLFIIQESAKKPAVETSCVSAISESFIAEAKYFLRFAADVYDDKPYISRDDVLLDQLGEHSHVSENVKIPRHVVFLDHLTQSIVVSIRGTGSVSDVLTDLHMDAQPFLRVQEGHIRAGAAAAGAAAKATDERGFLHSLERAAHDVQESISNTLSSYRTNSALYAHQGMAESAHALLQQVLQAVDDAHSRRGGRYADYQIVVTGHSLGAGTGCLLAMLIAANTSHAVKTFAFAPPPVISREPHPVEKPSSKMPHGGLHSNCIIHSFINHNDVVPRSSCFELLNLLSAIGSVDALPWTPTERNMMLLRGKLTAEEFQQMKEKLDDAKNYRKENEGVELCVPGHVYWLRRECGTGENNSDGRGSSPSDSRYRVQQLSDSRKLFNGYLYTGDSMVMDHLVVNYMDAILNIESSDKIK